MTWFSYKISKFRILQNGWQIVIPHSSTTPLLPLIKCFLSISEFDTPSGYIFYTLFLHYIPLYSLSPFFDTYVMGGILIVCLSKNNLWISIMIFNPASQLLYTTSRDWYWMSSLTTRLTKSWWVERWESFFINYLT